MVKNTYLFICIYLYIFITYIIQKKLKNVVKKIFDSVDFFITKVKLQTKKRFFSLRKRFAKNFFCLNFNSSWWKRNKKLATITLIFYIIFWFWFRIRKKKSKIFYPILIPKSAKEFLILVIFFPTKRKKNHKGKIKDFARNFFIYNKKVSREARLFITARRLCRRRSGPERLLLQLFPDVLCFYSYVIYFFSVCFIFICR